LNQLLSPAAALGSAATLGVADFTGGLAARQSPPPGVAIGVESIGLVVGLPFAIWLLPFHLDPGAAAFAFAAGAAGGLGLVLFYRAMAMNLIGVVAPVSAVVAAAMPVLVGVVVGGERLHLGQLAGIVVGLAAIALINAGGGTATKAARTAVGLAIAAGVGFGLFFILNHQASASGVTAFVTGRFGSAGAVLCFALISRVSFVPRREVLRVIAIGGSFDGVGVVLYLFATFYGLLSLSAVLTSFYPAFTVLCARIFIGEKLGAVQLAGAALAIAAIALIAAT
jgi:drug/metabolite transporter (DMT)-like permease